MRGVHRPGYMAAYRARKAVERDGAGLLPFQSSVLSAAVCRQDNPARDRGVVDPAWKRKIVAVRVDVGAFDDAWRSPCIRGGRRKRVSRGSRAAWRGLIVLEASRGPRWGSRTPTGGVADGVVHKADADAGEGYQFRFTAGAGGSGRTCES